MSSGPRINQPPVPSLISRQTLRTQIRNKISAGNEAVHRSDGTSAPLSFGEKPLLIGRQSGAKIPFSSREVSSRHAELQQHDGKLWIRDLGSTNGTYLDGQPISKSEWKQVGLESQISLGRNPENLFSLSGNIKKEVDLRTEGLASNGQRLKLPAEGSELSWGRSPHGDQTIAQQSERVSRNHLTIRQNAGAFWIKDVGSTHGTFLGDPPVPVKNGQWTEVKPGQMIDLAHQLQVRLVPAENPIVAQRPPNTTGGRLEVAQEHVLQDLDSVQSSSILKRAQVAPSLIGRATGVADLTPDYLQTAGFEPKQSMTIGDKKVHISKPYEHAGRQCTVGYVEDKDGNVKVRSFYRSSSHAMWKVASHAGQGGWFGKGVGQESVTLPLEAQVAMSSLPKATGTPKEEAEQLFYGALELSGWIPPESFVEQSTEKHLDVSADRPKAPEPSSVDFDNPEDRPDYTHKARTFQMDSNVQGTIKASILPSKNGSHDFLFCQDESGRTWIGGIFSRTDEVNSYGTKREWMSGGGTTSPAIDYYQEAHPQYVGDHVGGDYYDCSEFTHRIPVIKEFLNSQSQV
jgi:pSer/pThr/pTyr-binding forkhead associated (FHA) protein